MPFKKKTLFIIVNNIKENKSVHIKNNTNARYLLHFKTPLLLLF